MGQKTTADYWFQKGNKSFKLGQYKIACRAYENVVKIDPQNADAWNNIGISRYALVSRQSSRVAKFMMYYIHNQPRRIGYEEVHCCTF